MLIKRSEITDYELELIELIRTTKNNIVASILNEIETADYKTIKNKDTIFNDEIEEKIVKDIIQWTTIFIKEDMFHKYEINDNYGIEDKIKKDFFKIN